MVVEYKVGYKVGDWLGQSIVIVHNIPEEFIYRAKKSPKEIGGFKSTTLNRKHSVDNVMQD